MIRWPEDLSPAASSLHARNELETDMTPERIWPWLLRARRWPELYVNARRVRTPAPELTLGMRFTWWTFGVPVTTVIEELVPNERLAWRGTGLGAEGYHAWELARRGGGTHVITEETQRGLIPTVFRFALERGLVHFHQQWLEGLVRAARLGHPDSVPETSP